MSRYAALMRRLGHTRFFAAVAPRVAAPVDRVLHRVSGGRLHVAESFLPTLMLTCVGRKSGQPRRQPLAYVRDGDDLVVAATNFGREHHPAWSGNLLANPAATVELGGGAFPVTARLAEPEERERIWPKFVAMWPAYDTYLDRVDRTVRVFILELEP